MFQKCGVNNKKGPKLRESPKRAKLATLPFISGVVGCIFMHLFL